MTRPPSDLDAALTDVQPSNLVGDELFYASVYRAFWPHMKPSEVDEQEVFQLCVLLGRDQDSDSDWEMSDADRERMENFALPSEPGTDITQMVMQQMGITTG